MLEKKKKRIATVSIQHHIKNCTANPSALNDTLTLLFFKVIQKGYLGNDIKTVYNMSSFIEQKTVASY